MEEKILKLKKLIAESEDVREAIELIISIADYDFAGVVADFAELLKETTNVV